MARFGVPFVIAMLIAAVACHHSSTSPSTPSLAGTWVGITNDALVGNADFTATISQDGSSLSGTWASSAVEANDENGKNGMLSGIVSGSSVSLTCTPTPPPTPNPVSCPFVVTATVSENHLAGTFAFAASARCVPVTGSISLTRQ